MAPPFLKTGRKPPGYRPVFLTQEEAAAALGVTRPRVRQLHADGTLAAEYRPDCSGRIRPVYRSEDVERLKAEREAAP